MQRLILFLRNLVYKNRRYMREGNYLQLPLNSEQRLKKTTIKLRGSNNRLVIGENVTLTHCEIRLDGKDNLIEIGHNVRFSGGKIYLGGTNGQHIRIGADTTVEGAYLLVDEAASIDIGRDCMFSTEIIMRTGDKHSILDVVSSERVNRSRDIRIADRVWIGRDVTVLKGAVLHPETVVATRSLVSSAFAEGECVVAGVPARIVKRGVRWDRRLL
ncbi:acyltransferase [Pseudomonas saudiphocaensis]|uniref:acyltransferase n=1 Tax=Pseudomonas saudiphocaensis TaxID=1499686 RepID=UPI00187D30C4|nr:acyltransferase [Pseudomonas saudiphocaensis]MBE7927510.1 acyltransferase [Pseudomonas saudiphocaensis]